MTSPTDGPPIAAPHFSDSESSVVLPKQRKSPLPPLASLPYRRSNPSLNTLLASTSSLPSSRPSSASGTPTTSTISGNVFSPIGTTRSPSPANQPPLGQDDVRSLMWRSYAPYVCVLASSDTEELVKQKGFPGGFLELVRPFGETIMGKVTIRDSIGSSKTWDDYGIRFTGVKDGLGLSKAQTQARKSAEASRKSMDAKADAPNGPDPASQRLGGDVAQIEEAVDRHLIYSEFNAGHDPEYLKFNDPSATNNANPYHWLYLRRLLSSVPMTPHETFSHPVACVIAISSRNPDPISELRRLYASTNSGEYRLPLWVNNEFLRYYVLVHDEDHDDPKASNDLYDKMKKHFGLHCHLLRLRSSQCVASDDDSVRLPVAGWISAGEELAEIQRRELSGDDEDPTPCLFESDVMGIKAFVRELVTASLIPGMERLAATWNEQVASRRRGIGGRFISLSKRWTGFGSSSRSSSGSMGLQSSSGNNYDSLQGFYRPDTPEAIMRKLADYAFMLRDFKLARETYDILRSDYNNDKAWKYYAGACEMTALTSLMNPQTITSKTKMESIDQMLEAANYSYVMRCNSPYYALRTLALGVELLKLRGVSFADDAARWAGRIIETGLIGPIGHALFTERIGACYSSRKGSGMLEIGSRTRKAGLWAILAADAWLKLEKTLQAEKCLNQARSFYGIEGEKSKEFAFGGMRHLVADLQEAIVERKRAAGQYENAAEEAADEATLVEEVSEQLDDKRIHRKSLIGAGPAPFSSSDVPPLTPTRTMDDDEGFRDDNFE